MCNKKMVQANERVQHKESATVDKAAIIIIIKHTLQNEEVVDYRLVKYS